MIYLNGWQSSLDTSSTNFSDLRTRFTGGTVAPIAEEGGRNEDSELAALRELAKVKKRTCRLGGVIVCDCV